MLLRIARTRSPGILIFLIIVTFLLWWSSFSSLDISRFHFDKVPMPLYHLVLEAIDQNTLLNLIIAFFILLLQGIIGLRFNQRYMFIPTQTYLHIAFYLLIASSFVQLQRLNPGLLSSLFVFLMLDQLFSGYKNRYILNHLFMAGFLVAIAGLFYIHAIYFILLIWISLFILRSFSIREWVVPVLGFAFPVLFLFAIYYISEALSIQGLMDIIKQNYLNEITVTYYDIPYYVFFGLMALLVLFGSLSLLGRFPKLKIYVRKYYEILWWMFAGSVGLFFLSKQVSVEVLYFVALPLSFLLADYIHSIRSRVFGNIVLLLFVGVLVFIQYVN
ncbi:MAG: DUF6427 family protein [Bacteroidales bacterium]|nr:DUF6427 family protein [Bacteroidales bacterium]